MRLEVRGVMGLVWRFGAVVNVMPVACTRFREIYNGEEAIVARVRAATAAERK